MNAFKHWLGRTWSRVKPATLSDLQHAERRIMSKLSQLGPALIALGADLTAVAEQLDKSTQEIVNAVSNVDLPGEAQAALDNLSALSGRLKTAAQGLDDLNPDAEPPVATEGKAETAGTTDATGPSGDQPPS